MNKYAMIKTRDGQKYFFRFSANQRLQHAILATCVTLLVATGMPLKFKEAPWAGDLFALFGGIRVAPVIHKTVGCVLIALFIYHVFYLAYTFVMYQLLPLKKKKQLSPGSLLQLVLNQPLLPNLKDLRDIVDLIKYLLYMSDRRPHGECFTWKEKFDYWAPFWGIAIMGLSGLMMWFPESVTRFVSGEIINYALIAHSDEALLAALFLFIWHFYNVHFSPSVFPMGTVFLTGYLPEDLMREEHYAYYERVMHAYGLEAEILPPLDSRTASGPKGESVS